MFRNYLKTAWRTLWKNKATSLINLFGLSIGMTAAVFIFLWVQNELSFDNYHPGKENIYRITNAVKVNKDETWVCVWGKETDTNSKNKVDSTYLQENWMFNKDGKISYMGQFAAKPVVKK